MINYIVRRLLLTIPVLLGITFIVFALVTFAPGDAINLMLGSETVNPDNVERLRAQLGLDQPWYVQYGQYMTGLAQGDFGRSIMTQRPVLPQLLERFPNTLLLTVSAIMFAILIAIPLGVISASKRNTPADFFAMFGSMVGVSMPNFWLGLLLIILFGLELGWLPIRGIGSLDQGLWHFFSHLILPSVTLGTGLAAILTRLTRNALLDVMAEDYVRTAKAKGLANRVVLYKHALRNAVLPVVTTLGLQFGALLGGAIIIETIFSWPGMGLLTYNAIRQRDLPLIQGAVLLFAVCFVLVMLLIDMLYVLINPKIRYG